METNVLNAAGTTHLKVTAGLCLWLHLSRQPYHFKEKSEFKSSLLSGGKPQLVSSSPELKPVWMKVSGDRIKQTCGMTA